MIVSLERHPALRAEHVPSFLISFVVFVPVKGQSFPKNEHVPSFSKSFDSFVPVKGQLFLRNDAQA